MESMTPTTGENMGQAERLDPKQFFEAVISAGGMTTDLNWYVHDRLSLGIRGQIAKMSTFVSQTKGANSAHQFDVYMKRRFTSDVEVVKAVAAFCEYQIPTAPLAHDLQRIGNMLSQI
jgi:hypothetical protein